MLAQSKAAQAKPEPNNGNGGLALLVEDQLCINFPTIWERYRGQPMLELASCTRRLGEGYFNRAVAAAKETLRDGGRIHDLPRWIMDSMNRMSREDKDRARAERKAAMPA